MKFTVVMSNDNYFNNEIEMQLTYPNEVIAQIEIPMFALAKGYKYYILCKGDRPSPNTVIAAN